MPPGGFLRGLGPPLTPEERKQLLEDPGPTWREFFLFEFMKWWLGLAFLVVDVILVSSFFHPLNLVILVPLLAIALYLEVLAWSYLWTRPKPEQGRSREFQPTWHRPFRFGRWTPEAERLRAGLDPVPSAGPDPREFL
ncbi:MAG TPA: hypothetical protein VFF67_07635 [Thermoplasmata archaeon]|nr:hypothetical protein [Thermoplasmata archaeon]